MAMLMRVQARRFSAATATAVTPSAPPNDVLSKLTRMLKPQPIEELVEMKTLRSVQLLAEQVPANTPAKALTEAGDSHYRAWFQSYQQQKNLASVDQAAFEELMKDVTAFIQTTETELLKDQPKISIGLGDADASEELRAVQEAYTEAIKLKLARHKVALVSSYFGHLDADQDGKIEANDVEKLLATVIEGSGDDWVRYQFQVHDKDGDDIVNETESKEILESIVATQRAVFSELFLSHVANLPKKKPAKMLASAIEETNWKEKIPEKIRCVFFYAPKEEEEGKTVHWESFKESQVAELPELNDIVRVYAKGTYDERYIYHETQQEKRSRRIKGLCLAIALGVGDYVFALV